MGELWCVVCSFSLDKGLWGIFQEIVWKSPTSSFTIQQVWTTTIYAQLNSWMVTTIIHYTITINSSRASFAMILYGLWFLTEMFSFYHGSSGDDDDDNDYIQQQYDQGDEKIFFENEGQEPSAIFCYSLAVCERFTNCHYSSSSPCTAMW